MSGHFDFAVQYVLSNEGAYSNEPADRGGETFYGISRAARMAHRCDQHSRGIEADDFRRANRQDGIALATHVYRLDYWTFGGIVDPCVAAKVFDIDVNMGVGIGVIQGAVGAKVDNKWGPKTLAAVNALSRNDALERLSVAVADHYVDECLRLPSQLKFLKGWMRRAVRRPHV